MILEMDILSHQILNGAMIYNTTDNEFQVRKGGAWVNL